MTWSWAGLVTLGAFHGINPGMGWLFAVALGMQERRRAAVYRAMLPLAFGHALSIAGAIVIAIAVGAILPLHAIQWAVAAVLLALGIARLFRHRHPRWVGMRVGMKDLTVWSFLMATAHGAGLMVLPVVLGGAEVQHHPGHPAVSQASSAAWATVVHSAAYLGVTAVVALIVYEKLGVGLLRKTWINFDVVWAVALIVAALATLLMA
jgi:hypothetical protein